MRLGSCSLMQVRLQDEQACCTTRSRQAISTYQIQRSLNTLPGEMPDKICTLSFLFLQAEIRSHWSLKKLHPSLHFRIELGCYIQSKSMGYSKNFAKRHNARFSATYGMAQQIASHQLIYAAFRMWKLGWRQGSCLAICGMRQWHSSVTHG